MITIWAYNLTKFTYEMVEVDYIKEGKTRQAIKSRIRKEGDLIDCNMCNGGKTPCSCNYNTLTYVKFEMSEELAKQRIKDYLSKEITARLRRVHKLIAIHSKYEEDSFKRFVIQPIKEI